MSGSSSSDSFPEAPAAAVIVAGGSGKRMGTAEGLAKQYLEVAGAPILLRAVRAFVDHPGIARVVVVLPPRDASTPPAWLAELPVRIVAGGLERSDSVWNGLQALSGDTGAVLIHDGARPFVPRAVIDRVLAHAAQQGVIAGLPATDTIKVVDEHGIVTSTPDRSRMWHAQTPQGFPYRELLEAYRRATDEGWSVTDDASLWERSGRSVLVVDGDAVNLKITRPLDLEVAGILARSLRHD